MLERKIEDNSIVFWDGNRVVLSIQEHETEGVIKFTMAGQLRSEIAHDIQDELVALTTIGADIVVDMKDVTYISSTSQHVFLRVQQKMDTMGKGSLTLCNLSEDMFREFERTGASELLVIEN